MLFRMTVTRLISFWGIFDMFPFYSKTLICTKKYSQAQSSLPLSVRYNATVSLPLYSHLEQFFELTINLLGKSTTKVIPLLFWISLFVSFCHLHIWNFCWSFYSKILNRFKPINSRLIQAYQFKPKAFAVFSVSSFIAIDQVPSLCGELLRYF